MHTGSFKSAPPFLSFSVSNKSPKTLVQPSKFLEYHATACAVILIFLSEAKFKEKYGKREKLLKITGRERSDIQMGR